MGGRRTAVRADRDEVVTLRLLAYRAVRRCDVVDRKALPSPILPFFDFSVSLHSLSSTENEVSPLTIAKVTRQRHKVRMLFGECNNNATIKFVPTSRPDLHQPFHISP